uniref:Leucine rich repeat protein n=1 Tax=Pithovirus LCPAC001 TaxID=2506585 RepID=A0A481Z1R7_9VIRU|nr:MAG: leucine rich repeat protein [Pithovirus LCPAC001]
MSLNQRIEEWLEDTTQKLDISRLNLTEWPKKLIGKEHFIKNLYCYNNKLTSLPNNLHEVPWDFVPWTNLEMLNRSYNKLTYLSNSLINLKELICYNNKLTSLPNGLSEVPEGLPSWPNLKILYCFHNQLTSLPNGLSEVPEGLPSWPNLEELLCFNNKLTSLPNSLTNLKKLICSNNKLFSNSLKKWKKIWPISIRHQHILRTAGIKRVIKVLKNRSYLPSLNELREELIWSPNHSACTKWEHPGKFFTSLPRVGYW